jgi:purine-nucleoside phosphorylase
VALVLGSGMSAVAQGLRLQLSVPFGDIPGLPAASVVGHRGCVTLGDWSGKRVLVCEGRLHFYEGHAWENVVMLVQLAAELGVRLLLQTNAAGGIHDALGPGSLMALRDHIEWTRPYCWREPGPGAVGPPRPSPYSPRLLDVLERAATELSIPLLRGTYGAVTGPCYAAGSQGCAHDRRGAGRAAGAIGDAISGAGMTC